MRVKSFDSSRVFCWRPSNLELSNQHMECKILLLFGWILLLLLLSVNVGNVSALDDNNSTDCYWSGQGPICDGKCRPGETTVASRKNDGNGCIIGKKKYCCKTGTAESDSAAQKPQQQQLDEIKTEATTTDTKDDCYWVGKSPTCVGSCLEGDYTAITSRTGNGSTCIVGKKKYCCKVNVRPNNKTTLNNLNAAATKQRTDESMKQMTNSSCYWVGHAPICLGSCKFAGDYVTKKSATGDGGSIKCESGQKKLCCPRGHQLSTTTEESDHKTTVGDHGQNDTQLNLKVLTNRPFHQQTTASGDNNNGQLNESVDAVEFFAENSVSNSSTHRPFHLRRRRPTSTGQPNNPTVNNHLKIVKIKRKLVMSTPTNDLTSTSIPLPSSFVMETTSLSALLSSIPESTKSWLPFHHFHRDTTADSVTSIPTTTSTTTPSTPVSTTLSTMFPTAPISATSSAASSTFRETESTSVATVALSTSLAPPASAIMQTTTSIPTTTTMAMKMLTKPFFNLPDVLPVPLIFRLLLRPTIKQFPNSNDVNNATSTLDAATLFNIHELS